eukprot:g20407.t1
MAHGAVGQSTEEERFLSEKVCERDDNEANERCAAAATKRCAPLPDSEQAALEACGSSMPSRPPRLQTLRRKVLGLLNKLSETNEARVAVELATMEPRDSEELAMLSDLLFEQILQDVGAPGTGDPGRLKLYVRLLPALQRWPRFAGSKRHGPVLLMVRPTSFVGRLLARCQATFDQHCRAHEAPSSEGGVEAAGTSAPTEISAKTTSDVLHGEEMTRSRVTCQLLAELYLTGWASARIMAQVLVELLRSMPRSMVCRDQSVWSPSEPSVECACELLQVFCQAGAGVEQEAFHPLWQRLNWLRVGRLRPLRPLCPKKNHRVVVAQNRKAKHQKPSEKAKPHGHAHRKRAVEAPKKRAGKARGPAVPATSSEVQQARLDAWPPQHRPNGTMLKQPWVSGGQGNPCVPALHHLPPRGDYEYHPSDLEKQWIDVRRRGKICATAKEQEQQAQLWLSYTASVLSYFSYPRPDGSRVNRYLEPLHGAAGHPLASEGCAMGNQSIDEQNVTYLLPENACTKEGNRTKGVFFDLGCGANVVGFENYDYAAAANGSGMRSSIPFFFRMYADRCIDFQAIYAWQAERVDHKHFWDPLPDPIRARFRFFNRPVQEHLCPDSPQGNLTERGGFLKLLTATVSLEDYVVVKVDMGSLALETRELAIVESIAHLPELSNLIDELYFDYHFYTGIGGDHFGGDSAHLNRYAYSPRLRFKMLDALEAVPIYQNPYRGGRSVGDTMAPSITYRSTRGGATGLSFEQAVFEGLAPDGGLMVPETVPDVSKIYKGWSKLKFHELAFEVASLFCSTDEVVPSVKVNDLYVMELFHGPTFAFKDVALQVREVVVVASLDRPWGRQIGVLLFNQGLCAVSRGAMDYISQAHQRLHAPSSHLMNYLSARKGGHNFLQRGDPKPRVTRCSATEGGENGGEHGLQRGISAGENSPRNMQSGSRNGSRMGSRSNSRSGSRNGSRHGSQDADASETYQAVHHIRSSLKQGGTESQDMHRTDSYRAKAAAGAGTQSHDVQGFEVQHTESARKMLEVPAGRTYRKQNTHESLNSCARSEQGSGGKRGGVMTSLDESDGDAQGSNAVKPTGSIRESKDFKPRHKANASAKALIQTQRLRSARPRRKRRLRASLDVDG